MPPGRGAMMSDGISFLWDISIPRRLLDHGQPPVHHCLSQGMPSWSPSIFTFGQCARKYFASAHEVMKRPMSAAGTCRLSAPAARNHGPLQRLLDCISSFRLSHAPRRISSIFPRTKEANHITVRISQVSLAPKPRLICRGRIKYHATRC